MTNDSYIIQYNGYTFQDSDNYVFSVLDGVSGRPIRVAQNNLVGADGGNIWGRNRGMRDIVLSGVVGTLDGDFGSYYDTLRRNMALAFDINSTLDTLQITRPDGVTRSIKAKVVEEPIFTETPGEETEAEFSVVLRSESGLIEDANNTTATLEPGVPGGSAVASPVPTPLGSVSNTLIINNTGDGIIYPEYKLDGFFTDASITNSTTGQSMVLSTTVSAGNYILAYTDPVQGDYILLNGLTNLYAIYSGNIPFLAKGNNVLRFNAASFDGNALMTVTWKQNYKNL